MASYNSVTGDLLISKTLSKTGEESFERIFGVKKKTNGGWKAPSLPLNEYPEYSEDWQSESRDRAIAQNGNVGYSPSDME
jgi:hypothetical protein